ncbi:MAG: hypothetical protein WCE45_03210, partial [Sedimentisphaerales bacterium]
MFVLNSNDFNNGDNNNINQFIEFWSQFIPLPPKIYGQNERISYIHELNLDNDLTEANMKRLLRWKDPRFLTEKGDPHQPNPLVQNVLRHIQNINNFRRFETDKEIIGQIFPDGLIYKVFLFHIARPTDYPIADQNIFRSFAKISGSLIPIDKNSYNTYKTFFFNLCREARINNNDVQ